MQYTSTENDFFMAFKDLPMSDKIGYFAGEPAIVDVRAGKVYVQQMNGDHKFVDVESDIMGKETVIIIRRHKQFMLQMESMEKAAQDARNADPRQKAAQEAEEKAEQEAEEKAAQEAK